ncbi:MAG: hypothetical protein M3T96_02365 [Acidobacteriota bacterium]|nr:hypothetical protein [Acidobacteriota bacterium]
MKIFKIIILILLAVSGIFAQSDDLLLKTKLKPEIWVIVAEIEKKTHGEINSAFAEPESGELGSSFIGDDGTAYIRVDEQLRDSPELAAVIAHEIFHLQLRVRGFPVFLFSPTIKTARGLAQDVEQPNVNDLTSAIEHLIFKPEMQKLGLYDQIKLAGATAAQAQANRGKIESQADALNYTRAILEYNNPEAIEEVRKIYVENNWTRSLRDGKAIADIISRTNSQTPEQVEQTFLSCLTILYAAPKSSFIFKLTPDSNVKTYRQMIIKTARKTYKQKS